MNAAAATRDGQAQIGVGMADLVAVGEPKSGPHDKPGPARAGPIEVACTGVLRVSARGHKNNMCTTIAPLAWVSAKLGTALRGSGACHLPVDVHAAI